MKGPWKKQLEENLYGGTTLKTTPDARQVTFRGLAILYIYSCLGKRVYPCPLQGNIDDEVKDNVATVVEKG